jgi:peptidoglycan biosynthesis protein MviN/MurJ (putative lipid II flippase)
MNQALAWASARYAEPSTKAGLGVVLGGVAMLLPTGYAQIVIGVGIAMGIHAAVKADPQ